MGSKKKLGIALSGGGPRGLAHIGVLKKLEANNIDLDYIAGTSIGAFIGAIYAATKNLRVLEEIALETNWKELAHLFFDPAFKGGLISGNKIIKLIERYIGDIDFKDLKIPFTAVATDFKTGKIIEINNGKVSQAIRASIAIPFFFQPIISDNRLLFDGGLTSPLPVDTVKKMGADYIIGVDLYYDYLSDLNIYKLNLISVLQQSIKILLHNYALKEAKEANIVITPQLKKIGWTNLFSRKGSLEGIIAGEKATEEMLSEIKALVGKREDFFITSWLKKIGKYLM